MKVVVFTGPTVSASEGRTILASAPRSWATAVRDVTYLPPVTQGDVYAAARERPWAIAIVDGYFERVPAVWHKEILWAMSQGVRVYGASSMGALRAAELHTLGMRGVGEIFELFARGDLEDDDEVTLVHGSEDDGYVSVSEPMVNLRFTFAAAEREGIIGRAARFDLTEIAKAMFYPDRRYEAVVDRGRERGLSLEELDRLSAWLPSGRVDQKRLDALAMLQQIDDDMSSEGGEPFRVTFQFQHTDAWEQVRREIDRRFVNDATSTGSFPHDAVFDELRLRADLHAQVRQDALIRAMARELAGRTGQNVSDSVIRRVTNDLRLRHSLDDAEAVRRWLEEQGLSEVEFADLLVNEASATRVREIFEADLDSAVGEVLRLSGRYRQLADLAMAKQQDLVSRGLENPTMVEARVQEPELWRWYFEDRLGREVPTDLALAALHFGYRDLTAMRRTVLREYCHAREWQSPQR